MANGVVYVGSDDFSLSAYDASGSRRCSGRTSICTPLWTTTTGNNVVSSPAVANGTVYFGSFDNALYAFSLAQLR